MSRRVMDLPPHVKIPPHPGRPRTDLEQLALAQILSDAFLGMGLRPVGTEASKRPDSRPVLDPAWGADLGELISRAEPHELMTDLGPETVAVKLETIRAEVDRLGEICAWIYEES